MLLEYVAIAIFIALTTLVGVIAIVLGTIFGPKRPAGKKSMPSQSDPAHAASRCAST